MDDFDFDMASRGARGSLTPGDSLRIVYGSESGKKPGSRNIAGIADPAVDALIERIVRARHARGLRRRLPRPRPGPAAGHLLGADVVPATDGWPIGTCSRDRSEAANDSGAPATWWYDAEKARIAERGRRELVGGCTV